MKGIRNEPDLFGKDQFKAIESNKAHSHFCLECVRVNVELNVKNKMNWREGEKYDSDREKLRHQLWQDYLGIFLKECYRRFTAKQRLKKIM